MSSKEGLNRNRIGKFGCKSLAELLKISTSLQFLNLSGNGLGEEAFKVLLNGIKCNLNLLHLNVSNNDLTVQSIESLA